MFQHQTQQNQTLDLPLGKVVCVGRNYAEHAKELGNEIPDAPILFIKPATSVVSLENGFSIPQDQGSVHHEAEIALLISKQAKNISADNAWDYVSHVTVALDLTLRDVQSKLKEKSHPWEIAKGFDGACPLGKWVAVSELSNKDNIAIELIKNGEQKQMGNSTQMITSIADLVAYISTIFTLQPGDVILTGTPAGVGPLESGDQLKTVLDEQFSFTSQVL
ncbi:MAG: 2-keto-4-pentenoate hydratase/2-oxohepta-3-ene-1,7-dioic acid hydratase in catechol pathway [Oceanicoccus sp.]|jgi:2-keto-4-pentenoate hydratase/2-oxohepta-3-ene-1,7-dioic acid hydratase in catechol pathway